jgi:N utilization substance protein B
MGSRRRAREYAIQILYQLDLRECHLEEVLRHFWVGLEVQPEQRDFAESEVRGVLRNLPELDGLIERFSMRWKLNRMPLVDRNILRLGAYELLYVPEVPLSVALNEAIELAKRYSSIESGAFINGILDKVARLVPEDAKRDAEAEQLDDNDDFLYDDGP